MIHRLTHSIAELTSTIRDIGGNSTMAAVNMSEEGMGDFDIDVEDSGAVDVGSDDEESK